MTAQKSRNFASSRVCEQISTTEKLTISVVLSARTGGQVALHTRFRILPLKGRGRSEGEGLGFLVVVGWWGKDPRVAISVCPCPRTSRSPRSPRSARSTRAVGLRLDRQTLAQTDRQTFMRPSCGQHVVLVHHTLCVQLGRREAGNRSR